MLESLKAYPRAMWMLAVSIAISAIGESFLWPLTTSYIETFGKSLMTAGFVLLLQYATMLLGNLAGGWLFDRWSGRKTLIVSITIAMLILVAMGTWQSFELYVGLLMLLGFCQGTYWPVQRALSTVLWPEGGRRAINMVYVANNLGVAIGAVLGGLLASASFKWAFYGNALSYILFLALFLANITEDVVQKAKSRSPKTPAASAETVAETAASVEAATGHSGHSSQEVVKGAPPAVSRDTWFALFMLTVGLGFMVVTYIQWQTTVSMYVQSSGISLSSYSVLWTVNGLVIVLLQPLLSWSISRFAWTLQVQILIGAALFALSMTTVLVWPSYAGFVLGMVILTMGEMLAWPGVPALAAEMAVPGREGLFQGIVTSGQSAGRMVGPLVGAFLFEQFSAQAMIGLMIVLCLVAAGFFLTYNKVKI